MKTTKNKANAEPLRNVTAMHMKQKSKKFAHKGERRSKDTRRSWRNEDHD